MSSPAPIEKVRTATTDASVQYRVVGLPGGTYAVTFSLPGFAVVKREGIEVAGGSTATVSAELRVGALEETVIVTRESPIVDVQSARKQAIIDRDVLKALPTARATDSISEEFDDSMRCVRLAGPS